MTLVELVGIAFGGFYLLLLCTALVIKRFTKPCLTVEQIQSLKERCQVLPRCKCGRKNHQDHESADTGG